MEGFPNDLGAQSELFIFARNTVERGARNGLETDEARPKRLLLGGVPSSKVSGDDVGRQVPRILLAPLGPGFPIAPNRRRCVSLRLTLKY